MFVCVVSAVISIIISDMNSIWIIPFFFIGMVISNGVNIVLHKFEKTISPVNQNVINMLGCFYIQCLNIVVTTQVRFQFNHAYTLKYLNRESPFCCILYLEQCLFSGPTFGGFFISVEYF